MNRFRVPCAALFAFLILCGQGTLLLAQPVSRSGTLYRSNALGMELERISQSERGTYDYVLEVSRSGSTESRTLYNGSQTAWQLERTFDAAGRTVREERFEGGNPVWARRFDASGRIMEERQYKGDGTVNELISYAYQGNLLVSRRSEGGSGKLRYTDTLSYYGAGKLREVKRTFPDGRTRTAHYAMADGRLLEERFSTESGGSLLRYNEAGRLAYREVWDGKDVTEIAWYSYSHSGSSGAADAHPVWLSEERTVHKPEGSETVVNYDRQGRRTRVEEKDASGNRVSLTRYEYGENGPVSVTRDTGNRNMTTTYRYNEDGSLFEKRVTRDGVLTEVVVHTGPERHYEERYKDGELYVRTFYQGEDRTREEYVMNGRVVRSVEIPNQ